MRSIFKVLVLLFSLNGCTLSKTGLHLDDTLESKIKEYVTNNPQYNTFLLMDAVSFRDTYPHKEGYLLGPMYEGMINKHKSYTAIKWNNSMIYIQTGFTDVFRKQDINWNNMNPNNDSILNIHSYRKEISYNKRINYIYRSVFLYYDCGKWCSNNRSDTLFIVPSVESQLIFDVEENLQN